MFCLLIWLIAVSCSPGRAQSNISFSTIFSFDGTNGARPAAGLTLGTDGNLYGTTCGGGSYEKGTIFKITPAGKLTTLFSFSGTDGYTPDCVLVQGRDGTLYGTTRNGGNRYDSSHQNGCGTIFHISTDGTGFKNLYLFNGKEDFYGVHNGFMPIHGLTLTADGSIYGITAFGGATGEGTLFRVNTNGDFKTIFSVSVKTPGPDSGLILGRDGNMYGTTIMGGEYKSGMFFRLTSDGTISNLTSFSHTDLFVKHNNLVESVDGAFYGTTETGGEFHNVEAGMRGTGDGTFFKVTASGKFKLLASFNGRNGSHPEGALVEYSGGSFYGVTTFGSPTLGTIQRKWETLGTIFKVTSDGTITTLFSFNGQKGGGFPTPSGAYPNQLVQDNKGTFYGTTALGGTISSHNINGYGTIFRFSINSKAR